MRTAFENGVYPVMLTPFTEDNQVDYKSLERLIEWYLEAGAVGLFAVCQSSEMFFLSLEERVKITQFVVEKVRGRATVIASGHVAEDLVDQANELKAIADAGADAVIMLTNRLAKATESDEIWLENLKKLLTMLPEDLPLGFYECPYPYKRVMTPDLLKWCAKSGRFYFTKDTSCDITNIKEKLAAIKGSQLKLFNANSSTLLASLQEGASGFSGVMANFHPELYVWLTNHFDKEPDKAENVADFLTVASMIERQVYPINAKYYQQKIGNFHTIASRTKDSALLNNTCKSEVEQLIRITDFMKESNFCTTRESHTAKPKVHR